MWVATGQSDLWFIAQHKYAGLADVFISEMLLMTLIGWRFRHEANLYDETKNYHFCVGGNGFSAFVDSV